MNSFIIRQKRLFFQKENISKKLIKSKTINGINVADDINEITNKMLGDLEKDIGVEMVHGIFGFTKKDEVQLIDPVLAEEFYGDKKFVEFIKNISSKIK